MAAGRTRWASKRISAEHLTLPRNLAIVGSGDQPGRCGQDEVQPDRTASRGAARVRSLCATPTRPRRCTVRLAGWGGTGGWAASPAGEPAPVAVRTQERGHASGRRQPVRHGDNRCRPVGRGGSGRRNARAGSVRERGSGGSVGQEAGAGTGFAAREAARPARGVPGSGSVAATAPTARSGTGWALRVPRGCDPAARDAHRDRTDARLDIAFGQVSVVVKELLVVGEMGLNLGPHSLREQAWPLRQESQACRRGRAPRKCSSTWWRVRNRR